jgi:hypothetical protein
MKRTIITIGATLLAVVPATVGLTGNASFAQTVPVRAPSHVTAVDVKGGAVKQVEAGDDKGGAVKQVEAGDDKGGQRATRKVEAGDDKGGQRATRKVEAGDDKGGHGRDGGHGHS